MKTLYFNNVFRGTFSIPTSKSYSNRALILRALHPQVSISELSTAADTQILKQALTTTDQHINIGHAGTAMRFATAYFANALGKEIELGGSERMNNRPIKVLVNALRELGAEIQYLNKEGYPPIRIKGQNLEGGHLTIDASVSSQYITALMLLGTAVPEGITLHLTGKIVSQPYLTMTRHLIEALGGHVNTTTNTIHVQPLCINTAKNVTVPGDWSSAAFAFAHVSAGREAQLFIPNLSHPEDQADGAAVALFNHLGVASTPEGNGYLLYHKPLGVLPQEIDCTDFPDLVPALAAAAAFHGKSLHLNGLETLRIKETDRIAAIAAELANFGIATTATRSTLTVKAGVTHAPKRAIKTYDDHRMAMAFSIFAHRYPISIENPMVVEKSFPEFWQSLNNLLPIN